MECIRGLEVKTQLMRQRAAWQVVVTIFISMCILYKEGFAHINKNKLTIWVKFS